MSRKLNQMYNENLKLSTDFNTDKVIKKFCLTKYEIILLEFLYKDQVDEERILEYMESNGLSKKDAKKILPSIKKKGLVYAVEDVAAYDLNDNPTSIDYLSIYGTEIKT